MNRSWAGVPSEERSAARLGQLLDVGFDLLGREGWSAVTVRGVCRAARLHPRYFYQAFNDPEDLLVAVFDRLIADLRDAVETAVTTAGHTASARAHAGLEAVARFVSEDRRRARVLYTEALGNDRLNLRRLEAMEQFVGSLVPGGDDPAAEIAAHIAVGGFTSVLVAWLDGRLDVSMEELVGDAAVILLAAGRAAARSAGGRTGRES